MILTETIEWMICNKCEAYAKPHDSSATGWLVMPNMSLYNVPIPAMKTHHLCKTCRGKFLDFLDGK